MKKPPGDIIILHSCNINDSHIMYGSWDTKHNRQGFLSSWTIFVLLPPLTTWKIKILRKWKKCLEILSFPHVCHKWQSYDVWFLRYGAWRTQLFVILDHFLYLHHPPPPNNPKIQKFEKMEENSWRYYHFTHVHHKKQTCDVWFLRYGVWRTQFFVILDCFLLF